MVIAQATVSEAPTIPIRVLLLQYFVRRALLSLSEHLRRITLSYEPLCASYSLYSCRLRELEEDRRSRHSDSSAEQQAHSEARLARKKAQSEARAEKKAQSEARARKKQRQETVKKEIQKFSKRIVSDTVAAAYRIITTQQIREHRRSTCVNRVRVRM
jgi:uncharacterized protein YhaN